MRQDRRLDRSAAFFEFLAFLAMSSPCHGYVMATSRFSDSDISDTSWCQDLDMLHDVEVLGRSLVEALEPKLKQSGALAKSASNTCCKILQNSANMFEIFWDIFEARIDPDEVSMCSLHLITFYYLVHLVHFTESKRNSGHRNSRNSTCSRGLAPALEFCRSGLEKCDPVRLWKGRWCGIVCGPDEADPAAGGKRGTRFNVAFEYVFALSRSIL